MRALVKKLGSGYEYDGATDEESNSSAFDPTIFVAAMDQIRLSIQEQSDSEEENDDEEDDINKNLGCSYRLTKLL